jgi:Uma2 family endonuclease
MTTVAEPSLGKEIEADDGPQRFVFSGVDWAFYEEISRRLAERRAFVTFYKGKLEVVTTSLIHERTSSVLVVMIGVLAEEADVKLIGSGRATLKRKDLLEGTEPDASFYTTHAELMRNRKKICLPKDPPPDLAIEVEVTRRLGARQSIYQDVGVPEIWVYGIDGLQVMVRRNPEYVRVDASPTFPLLSPAELTGFVQAGVDQEQTAFTRAFRRRVLDALNQQKQT